jgi:DNA-binding MarR family transcriptional regulator
MSPSDQSDLPPETADRRAEVLRKLRGVIRAAQQHSAWVEKQCGVSGAQLWLLQELAEAGPLRVGDLARALSIHQTTTSNLVEALVRRRLVAKQRDPEDQRAVRVSLTAAGREVLARGPRMARGLFPSALAQMDGAALAQLDAGLDGLLAAIGGVDEEFGFLPMPFMM